MKAHQTKPAFDIRPSTNADIPAIVRIIDGIESHRSSARGFLNAQFTVEIIERLLPLTHVAVTAETVAGFTMLNQKIAPGIRHPVIHISQLGVSPEFQKSGCATALYEYVSEFADEMTANIGEFPVRNNASRAFHRNIGFEQTGTSATGSNRSVILRAKSSVVRDAIRSKQSAQEIALSARTSPNQSAAPPTRSFNCCPNRNAAP